MLFDFETFTRIVRRVYPHGNAYSLQQALSVFYAYFQRYEQRTGRAHPHIRGEQIRAIVEKMPYLERETFQGEYTLINPEDYSALIDCHFRTKYRRCDWNINHFFSGRIRELRFYEELY